MSSSVKVRWNTLSTWLWRIFGLYVLVMVGLRFYNSWQLNQRLEQKQLQNFVVSDLNGASLSLPYAQSRPQILIVWATWCGPCTIELKWLQSAIQDGDLSHDQVAQIAAISMGEDLSTVKATAQDRHYTFRVFVDPQGNGYEHLPIEATPTVFFLDAEQRIIDIDTGLSPLFLWKVKRHLRGS